jgi:tRNA threonylcarbamoyladenosine biosynthesis protein TsaB
LSDSSLCRVWQPNCRIITDVLILALDTSSPSGGLAVLRDQKIIGTVSTWTEEIYSSRIFRHLEFLLHELSVGPADFDLYSVVAGPGSFTGLRIGLTAVKGWAEVYRKPVAAVSALEAVAAQSRSPARTLVPLLDARRGQIYFGLYRRLDVPQDNRLALEGQEYVMTQDEFIETLRGRKADVELAIVTSEPALISDKLSRCESGTGLTGRFSVEQVSGILAPQVGQLGYLRAQRGDLLDALTLDANYIRRSDAELHLKGPAGS